MRLALIVTAAALTSTLALGACSTAVEAVRGPELAPIGYPAALVPTSQAYLPSPEQQRADRAASANSLWRTGARTFFGDQRARRIGDILTVNIDIDDRAQTQNSTQRSRTNEMSGGVTNFFGLENSLGRAFPGGFDPANLVGLEGALARHEEAALAHGQLDLAGGPGAADPDPLDPLVQPLAVDGRPAPAVGIPGFRVEPADEHLEQVPDALGRRRVVSDWIITARTGRVVILPVASEY